ncbi:hypothetical protein ERJ75_001097600 [Trypanosoma vivax]|nr:hypothetical protein ERJ75_001097600 [Trypanosoma vivax]
MGALRCRCGVVLAGTWPGVALPLAAAPCCPAFRSRFAVCPGRAARRSPTGTAGRTGLAKASHGTSGRVRAAGTVVWRSATKQCDAGCPTRVAPQTRKGRRAGGLRTAALLPDAQQDQQSSARTRRCAPFAPWPVKGRVAHVRGVAVRRRVARGCGRRHRGSARIDRASSGAARMGALRQEEGEVRCKVAPHASAQRRGDQRKHGREGKGGNAHRTFGVRRGAGARLCGEGTGRHHREDRGKRHGRRNAVQRVADTEAAGTTGVARDGGSTQEAGEDHGGVLARNGVGGTLGSGTGRDRDGALDAHRNAAVRAHGYGDRPDTPRQRRSRQAERPQRRTGRRNRPVGEHDEQRGFEGTTGKFCLGSSSAATQGSSTLQGALATALKGKQTYATAVRENNSATTTCGTPLNATINEEEEQNLETVKAKLDAEAVTQLLVTTNNIATASSDPASTCPLTSIAQDSNAGIYREHTVPACGPSQAKARARSSPHTRRTKWIPSKRSQKNSKASAPTRGTKHGKQHARLPTRTGAWKRSRRQG